MSERIQKVLAQAGIGSRRQIEEWIRQGRIDVNGQPATLGSKVGSDDRIRVDGKFVRLPESDTVQTRVLMYHKPAGEICTRTDPEGRPTVFDDLPSLYRGRWIIVGRLDINSSGLLLFTNNGELANRLMHPSYEIEREYAVRVLGKVSPESLERVQNGVALDEGMTKFDSIVDAGGSGANHWYHVVLKEGRNREVRRIWEAVGHQVSRLQRVRYGPVMLPRSVRPGKYQQLSSEDVEQLMAAVSLGQERPEHQQPKQHRSRPRTRTSGRHNSSPKKKQRRSPR